MHWRASSPGDISCDSTDRETMDRKVLHIARLPIPSDPGPDRPAGAPTELGELLESLRQGSGSERAASRLADLLSGRLAAYFGARRVPVHEIDDLVQIVLQRVFSGVHALRSGASFEPWLFTIARHVACTQGARRGRDPLLRAEPITEADGAVAVPSGAPDPEAILLAGEQVERLEREIRALPARQRQCLLLRALQELSYEEIGELLGISAHTVRNHLAEARETLRRHCGEVSENAR